MSNTMHATPIWLGGACSNEAFLSGRLAVVPDDVIEHLRGKCCVKLKYIQADCLQYKHVKKIVGKSEKSVQKLSPQRRQPD